MSGGAQCLLQVDESHFFIQGNGRRKFRHCFQVQVCEPMLPGGSKTLLYQLFAQSSTSCRRKEIKLYKFAVMRRQAIGGIDAGSADNMTILFKHPIGGIRNDKYGVQFIQACIKVSCTGFISLKFG